MNLGNIFLKIQEFKNTLTLSQDMEFSFKTGHDLCPDIHRDS